ncbi:hypothetical protein PHLCEN_2v8236 [Hermanssonia centrifuga]|uniref:Endoplasmic reticulum vesicle transporter C-terminal domain-containing protein n=1 Tax=Hermanssonia centrifuga TaxID=98765 RepID=A0A2R6NUA9_9APHY|nr:hypothetical protein PHLCEN_2v8236 [Hermanssonia centrifuga]
MDISGETQTDITHNIFKTRLDDKGKPVANSQIGELRNDIDKLNEQRQNGYCGSCYGGVAPDGGCCNSCEDVRQSYVNRGWSFNNPDSIQQCVNEGWSEKLKEQASEGCNIAGGVRVNKVVGNIHLSPGRSFRMGAQSIYELVPYLKEDGNRHDFTHTIHEFGFEGDDEYDFQKAALGHKLKQKLGIEAHPLDGTTARINTHQYSATHFERDLSKGLTENSGEGVHVMHGMTGIPGAFFNFEISPILIVHQETRQSFAHFLTSVAFATSRKLKKSGVSVAGYTNGKHM